MTSVATIIFNEKGEVLLIKRKDVPVWVLPGGGIDAGETPEQAALRETEEETGYTVKLKRKIAEYTPANRITKFTHFYECAITGGAQSLTDETSGIAFFSLDKLPLRRIPPPYLEWITDAKKNTDTIHKTLTSITYPLFVKTLLLHPILTLKFLLTKLRKK
ncbi:MAG: NUDIX hydrolase [Simkaniaceae bacterium]|nr:NUDIX hydrolase [Simkaniaceae bacterium]